jgi:hypothetical protein
MQAKRVRVLIRVHAHGRAVLHDDARAAVVHGCNKIRQAHRTRCSSVLEVTPRVGVGIAHVVALAHTTIVENIKLDHVRAVACRWRKASADLREEVFGKSRPIPATNNQARHVTLCDARAGTSVVVR